MFKGLLLQSTRWNYVCFVLRFTAPAVSKYNMIVNQRAFFGLDPARFERCVKELQGYLLYSGPWGGGGGGGGGGGRCVCCGNNAYGLRLGAMRALVVLTNRLTCNARCEGARCVLQDF